MCKWRPIELIWMLRRIKGWWLAGGVISSPAHFQNTPRGNLTRRWLQIALQGPSRCSSQCSRWLLGHFKVISSCSWRRYWESYIKVLNKGDANMCLLEYFEDVNKMLMAEMMMMGAGLIYTCSSAGKRVKMGGGLELLTIYWANSPWYPPKVKPLPRIYITENGWTWHLMLVM